MRFRRSFLLACATIVLAACGELLGADDDTTPPPRPGSDSGSEAGGDDGAIDTGVESGTDGGACTADGSLDLVASFMPASVNLAAPRAATSSAGDVVVVGRCGDGGLGLEMALVAPSGTVGRVASCFGSTSTEQIMSVARTASGYVVASNRVASPLRARVTHVSQNGTEIGGEELAQVAGYNASYVKFAVEVPPAIVWGGLRTQFGSPDRGFLKVMTKGPIEFPPGEVPVSATVSGGRLYVANVRALEGSSQQELFVRRYDMGPSGNLVADPTLQNGTPPVLEVSFVTVDGIGAMVVDGDAVMVVAGTAASTRVLRLANAQWTQEIVPVFSPARLVQSCDGTLIVAGPAYLDGSANTEHGLVRRANGQVAGELKMPDALEISDLLREPNGDLLVVQGAGTVRRVSP